MKKALLIATPVIVGAAVVGYVNRGPIAEKLDHAVASGPDAPGEVEAEKDATDKILDPPAPRQAMAMTEDGAYEAAMKALRTLMRRDENLKAYADIEFKRPESKYTTGGWDPLTSGNFAQSRPIYHFNPGGDRNGPPHYNILVTSLEDGYHVYQVFVYHGGQQLLTYKHSPDERDPGL